MFTHTLSPPSQVHGFGACWMTTLCCFVQAMDPTVSRQFVCMCACVTAAPHLLYAPHISEQWITDESRPLACASGRIRKHPRDCGGNFPAAVFHEQGPVCRGRIDSIWVCPFIFTFKPLFSLISSQGRWRVKRMLLEMRFEHSALEGAAAHHAALCDGDYAPQHALEDAHTLALPPP